MGSKNTVFRADALEFDKFITADGIEYAFNNSYDRFSWARTGDGTPPINYRTERGPFQDGSTPLGFVLGERIIQMVHRRSAGCRDDYWNVLRVELLNAIRPNRQASVTAFQPGCLRKVIADGTKRDLLVFVESGPLFRGQEIGKWDEFTIEEAFRFVAHDPLFFDPNESLVELTLPASGDELSFAITFPITFSSDGGVVLDTINYSGTYKTFPTITIQGPIRNPVITNITTEERIELDTTIEAGRSVTINLAFGNKTVFDDLGTNLIGSLTTDSDLGSWHLAPDPEAPSGVNQIGTGGSSIDANTRIAMRWFDRYYGI